MSVFTIPKVTMDVLYKRFRDRDRRLIAQDILHIDHKLSTDERLGLAKKYGTDAAKVRKVAYALKDLSLITDKEGSIPLYEHTLRLEQMSKLPKIQTSPVPGQPVDDPNGTEDPENPPEGTQNPPQRHEEEEIPEEPPRVRDEVDRLKVQFGGFGTRMDGFQTQMGDIEAKINLLVANVGKEKETQVAKNPSQQTIKATVETAEVEDDAEIIFPSMDLETENPLDNLSDDVVELEGSVIATKRVGFTPKSLMLHDLARKKGFQGNFADFVNAAIYSAFKGRDFELVIRETL